MTSAFSTRTAPARSAERDAGAGRLGHERAVRHVRLGLLGLVLLFVLAGLSAPAGAQDDKKDLEFYLTYDPKGTKPKEDLQLRPNVPQEVFAFVENDGAKEEEVTVQLVASNKVEASQKVKAGPKGKTRVAWAPGKDDKAPALKDLKGEVLFRVVDGAGKKVVGDTPLVVMDPFTYLKAAASYVPAEDVKPSEDAPVRSRSTLTVNLDARAVYGGPRCEVALDLRPERLPGLVPGQRRDGQYRSYLSGRLVADRDDGPTTSLVARNLRIVGGESGAGFFYVDADNYRRAFTFFFTPPPRGKRSSPKLIDGPILRAGTPRAIRPTEKLLVTVESDGRISYKDRVELSLKSGTEEEKGVKRDVFSEVATFTGPRAVRNRYALPGPEGGVLFHPDVRDHATTLNLTGVTGETKMRLRLLGTDGKPKLVTDGITGRAAREVIQPVILDDSPPEGLKFVETPPFAVRGRTVQVSAQVEAGPSGISEVVFYLGKPGPDGKMPADAVSLIGEQYVFDETIYSATFPVAKTQKTPLTVTAVATNGVGLSRTETIDIPVRDPDPTRSIIVGRVFEVDTPIDNLPVFLLNPKGQYVQKTFTSNGGRFEFAEVEAGSYKLYSRRRQTKSKGELAVKVTKPAVIKDLELYLIVPPPPAKEKPKLGSIAGTVREGERPQPGVPVRLLNEKGETVKSATTDRTGAYVIKDVEKGSYTVVATKSASRTSAKRPVGLGEAENKTGVDLKLFR